MYTKSVTSWPSSKLHCSCCCHFKAVYLFESIIKWFCQIIEKILVLACGITCQNNNFNKNDMHQFMMATYCKLRQYWLFGLYSGCLIHYVATFFIRRNSLLLVLLCDLLMRTCQFVINGKCTIKFICYHKFPCIICPHV